MLTDEKRAQREALMAYARRCTLPILGGAPKSRRRALQGSAVLYKARGEHFLATATHVVADQLEGELELGLPVFAKEPGQRFDRVFCPPDMADITVFKLQSDYAAAVEASGWHFVDGEVDLDRPHDPYDEILVYGYSAPLTTVDDVLAEAPVAIYTQIYDGPVDIEFLASSATPKSWDLLFHWPPDGVPAYVKGMSGGGVWGIRYSTTGLWTASRNLRPIAIETSIVPASAPRWIRTTTWDAVKFLIDHDA